MSDDERWTPHEDDDWIASSCIEGEAFIRILPLHGEHRSLTVRLHHGSHGFQAQYNDHRTGDTVGHSWVSTMQDWESSRDWALKFARIVADMPEVRRG
jgi:hypothetical protein